MIPYPKVVLGIITDGNKVLIGKVKEAELAEFGGIEYIFPGGKIEAGELSKEAVKREVLEETGLEVEIVQEIHKRIHPVTKREIIYVHCEGSSTETLRSDDVDIESLLWVRVNELDEYMPTLNPEVKTYLLSL